MSDEARERALEAYLTCDSGSEAFHLVWDAGAAHGWDAAVAALEEYVFALESVRHPDVQGALSALAMLRERGPAGRAG